MKLFSCFILILGAYAQQLVGVSTVGVKNTKRIITVAQQGGADYTTIQAAANYAQPGDLIQVRAGTYTEAPVLWVNGQPNAAIVFQNYPGEHPIIKPAGTTWDSSVWVYGNWIYLTGFEITNGWDGVVVMGSHNAVVGNYIHNNGDSCDVNQYCGQGVIIVSTTDSLISGNTIQSNGLRNNSPSHMHGIYLSDYYACNCMQNFSIMQNSVSNHGGAAIHSWDQTLAKSNVLITGNTLTNNVYEFILTHTGFTTITNNVVVHQSHPPTDSTTDSLIWLEYDLNVSWQNNQFTFGVTSPSSYLLYRPSGDNGLQNINFSGNTWNLPSPYVLTDSMVNAAMLQ